jgi:hypothetical protein
MPAVLAAPVLEIILRVLLLVEPVMAETVPRAAAVEPLFQDIGDTISMVVLAAE